MNEYIKQSIEGRKIAFTNSYELTSELQKRTDNLFKKIEELGNSCNDVMDFETKFASSPLSIEYNNLFTEIATTCKPIISNTTEGSSVKSDKEYLTSEVKDEAKYLIKDATLPIRRKAREEFDRKMRDTPLGKIEQASNTASVLRRLFKK